MMRHRNNGHRRASKKDGQNNHGKAGAVTAGKPEQEDQPASDILGQSPGSSCDLSESQGEHRTTARETGGDSSLGMPTLPKKKPWSEGTIQARAEEAVKRGPSAATLEWLEAESDEGNVEYKLRLKDPTPLRFQQLVGILKNIMIAIAITHRHGIRSQSSACSLSQWFACAFYRILQHIRHGMAQYL